MNCNIPKWSDNSREERYFTAMLFVALMSDASPCWDLLRPRLTLDATVSIVDVGYEVCMFRDLAHGGHIDRVPELEKQTFDLVFTLSNCELVLVEAKAHQRFNRAQLDAMKQAKDKLIENKSLGLVGVHLVGLHSSLYNPTNAKDHLDRLFNWKELAKAYPAFEAQLRRADAIFGN